MGHSGSYLWQYHGANRGGPAQDGRIEKYHGGRVGDQLASQISAGVFVAVGNSEIKLNVNLPDLPQHEIQNDTLLCLF